MTITIPDEALVNANITPSELRVEIGAYLYEKKRLTIGQARKLAGLDLITFQKELSKRNIYIHYDFEDLKTDLQNLNLL
jgi:predicted HTH domain antitoxin